jgi:ubiquinone/menaquinone biosynthesis C-methylase UbiE
MVTMSKATQGEPSALADLVRTQQRFMEDDWEPSPWLQRSTLTPWADYAWHASLFACRKQLPDDLSPHTFLIVQCGSGVDTHFYQAEGVQHLTVTDISVRALKLTQRHCNAPPAVIADTQHLPFRENAFDYVGVRSGLHHLEHPYEGLSEMARVARLGYFFVENQKTLLVPLLVRLGALEYEEDAGNQVYRFTRNEVAQFLDRLGATRYTIETAWFLQVPPLLALSKRIPGRLPLALFKVLLFVINSLIGRLGNAFCVVAHK